MLDQWGYMLDQWEYMLDQFEYMLDMLTVLDMLDIDRVRLVRIYVNRVLQRLQCESKTNYKTDNICISLI